MSVMKTLYKKELSSYFKTPLGYVFLVIFLFAAGYFTFEPGRGSFFILRVASLDAMFNFIPWLFVFLIPAVSMKLWAEERKSGTVELLLTLPIKVSHAVWAKFLASWTFIAMALVGTFPMIFTVAYLGAPDWGVIFTSYLAAFFMAGVLLAVSGFFSVLTKNQVVSFILSVVVSFVLIMAGSPPVLEFVSAFSPHYVLSLFESMSVLNHYESVQKGLINLGNFWFFSVMIFCWIGASVLLLNENKAN